MAKGTHKKKSSKKEVIIAKAAKLFRDKGFGAASMRDLAEHVGIEAASLYNHIQSKAEILQTICFRVANEFIEHLENVRASQASALTQMERIILFHIRMMLNRFEYVYISDHEWRHLPEPYLSNFLNQRRNYRKSLADILEQGIARGEIRQLEPYVTVLTILSAVSGIESWHRSRKSITPDVLERDMLTYLIEGLKK